MRLALAEDIIYNHIIFVSFSFLIYFVSSCLTRGRKNKPLLSLFSLMELVVSSPHSL